MPNVGRRRAPGSDERGRERGDRQRDSFGGRSGRDVEPARSDSGGLTAVLPKRGDSPKEMCVDPIDWRSELWRARGNRPSGPRGPTGDRASYASGGHREVARMGVPTTAQAEIEIRCTRGGGLRPRHRRDPDGRLEPEECVKVRMARRARPRSDRPSRATTVPARPGGRPWPGCSSPTGRTSSPSPRCTRTTPRPAGPTGSRGMGPPRHRVLRGHQVAAVIALADHLFLRNRQAQLEEGMAKTLSAIKATAEAF